MAAGALGSVSNRLRHENGDTHVVDLRRRVLGRGFEPRRLHHPSHCIRRRLSRRSSPEFTRAKADSRCRFELRPGKPIVSSTDSISSFFPPPSKIPPRNACFSRVERSRRSNLRLILGNVVARSSVIGLGSRRLQNRITEVGRILDESAGEDHHPLPASQH